MVSHHYGALIGKNLEYQLGLIEALASEVPCEGEAPAESGRIGTGQQLAAFPRLKSRASSTVPSAWSLPSARLRRC